MGIGGEEEGKRRGEGLGIESLLVLDLCTKLLLLLDLILSIHLTISIELDLTTPRPLLELLLSSTISHPWLHRLTREKIGSICRTS